jgi:ABC-type amino acid transport substrate-binding protein
MIRGLVAALAAGVLASSAQAADAIRDFPIATIESLGAAIYAQDSAAWVATDALREKEPDLRAAGVVGWLVEPAGAGQKVRFLRNAGGQLEIGYDVDVTPDLKTRLHDPEDRALTPDEMAMFAARQTAIQGLKGQPICRAGYNTVVLKDPEQPGWLVWLLAPLPADKVYAIGGHYRFSISADGRSVRRRDALSASCMTMNPKAGMPDGSQPVAYVVSHVVSPTPVETHVFVNLQARMPMVVLAGGRMWNLENGALKDGGPIPKR